MFFFLPSRFTDSAWLVALLPLERGEDKDEEDDEEEASVDCPSVRSAASSASEKVASPMTEP